MEFKLLFNRPFNDALPVKIIDAFFVVLAFGQAIASFAV